MVKLFNFRSARVLAGVFFCLLAPIAAQARPKPAAPVAVIKLEPYRKGVAVRMTVAGHPGLFTLDTAGGSTFLSPDFAAKAGCTPWGQMVGFRMTGDKLATARCDNVRLQAGGYTMTAKVAGVLDVAPLIAKDAAPIDGLLALDVFNGRTITIDFAAGELIVESQASAQRRIRGAKSVPVLLAREGGVSLSVMAQVPTPNGPLGFEIDSGNGGTLLVSKTYARLFGLDPDKQGPQPGAIKLADGVIAKGLVFTPDLILDGNLGMPFLKDWAVTLDLAKGHMWLKPSRANPPPGMGVPPVAPAS